MASPKLGTAELLFRCAQQMGLRPAWLTPQDVFAVTIDDRESYISLARSPLNSDAAVALAKNKYITRRILERHRLPNIPFALLHTYADAEAFLSEHGTIVAKPITGAGSRDIHIITEQAELTTLRTNHYILEKYISGKELRFLLLNGEVVGVHRSEYGTSVAADRPLQRISYSRSNWDPALIAISQHIADILALKFVAVDFIVDPSGQAYILEVNTMPGLKWFHAPTSGPVIDIAHLFLDSIVNSMRSKRQLVPSPVVSDQSRAYTNLVGAPS